MNSIDQQIAIAEAQGYQYVRNIYNVTGMIVGWREDADPKVCKLPNYLEDLNAMHEVEKTLDDNQWEMYWYILARITPGRPTQVCHATAAQRAEAYLRTINKWKD